MKGGEDMGETLKPCPFCSAPPVYEAPASKNWHCASVRCDNPCCRVKPHSCVEKSPEQAIAAWNARPTPKHPAGLPIVERLTKQVLLRITKDEGIVHGPINPDGPEAAEIIKDMFEALQEVTASNIRPGSRYNERLAREYERIQQIARAALARVRGGEAS